MSASVLGMRAGGAVATSRRLLAHAAAFLGAPAAGLGACLAVLGLVVTASHTVAQKAHAALSCALPRAMKATARRQTWAQSMSSAMQRAIALGSGSCRQAMAQWSQALAHSLQASMQD
jgi:hypothetical protein